MQAKLLRLFAVSTFCIAVLALVILSPPAQAGNMVWITNPAEAPEGVFVFAVMNIHTGEMTFGYPKGDLRNGGHYQCLRRAMGGLPTPGAGQGQHVGFGFVRRGQQIFIGRFSSIKAAGGTQGGIGFVNPTLPQTHPNWSALVPQEYSEQLFTTLVDGYGMELVLDNNIVGSDNFPFNHKKHDNFHLESFLDETWYIPGAIQQANRLLPWYNMAVGMFPPDMLGVPPGATWIPSMDPTAYLPQNFSEGYVQGLLWLQEQSPIPPPPAGVMTASNRLEVPKACRPKKCGGVNPSLGLIDIGMAVATTEQPTENGGHGAAELMLVLSAIAVRFPPVAAAVGGYATGELINSVGFNPFVPAGELLGQIWADPYSAIEAVRNAQPGFDPDGNYNYIGEW